MKVLIAEEKHGTRFIDVSDDQKLWAACCVLLTERLDLRYYSPWDEPKEPALSARFVAGMPESPEKDSALDRWRRYRHNKQMHDEAAEFEQSVKNVLKLPYAPDAGRITWMLLDQRSDGEYEHVEIETVNALEYDHRKADTHSD